MSWLDSVRVCVVGVGLSVLLAAPARATVLPGYTPGEFSVDPTGAATYQIPLAVPPGAAGMQPDLALLYHSRAGNGQLGVGWSLSGLSVISRCPAIRDSEGVDFPGGVTLSATDRFCLDGQTLRHQSGTYGGNGVLYFTEIQSFQNVRSYGNTQGAPTYFTVTDRAGLTRYYGQTADSRVTSVGQTQGVPLVWALNRIEDKHGNYISFTYGRDNALGEYWPAEVAWANKDGVALGRVLFNYDTLRADKTLGHGFGRTQQSLTRRLASIQVYEGTSNAVRRYNLTYLSSTGGAGVAGSPLSYLHQVQECAGTGSPCLPPTELYRSVGSRGVNSVNPLQIAGDFNTIYWMDVNGDGRPDGVVRNNNTVRVFFAKDNGLVTDTGVSSPSQIAFQHAVVLDYNGDGLMDLLVANTSTGYWNVYRSTGASFILEATPHLHYGAHNQNPVAADLSGNGVPELFFRHNGKLWFYRGADNGGFVSGAVNTGLTVSNGQRFHPLEFTGDGRLELFIDLQGCSAPPIFDPPCPGCDPDPCPGCDPYSEPLSSMGGGAEPGPSVEDESLGHPVGNGHLNLSLIGGGEYEVLSGGTNHCYHTASVYRWVHPAGGLSYIHAGDISFTKPRLLDLNGDGLTDVVALNTWGQVQAYINRGGFFEAQGPSAPPGPNWDKAVVFDYNLDGRDDVLFPGSNGYFQFFTYRDNEPAVGQTWISSSSAGYQVADWNGDGLADLLVRVGSSWRLWPHQGEREGLLTRVRNGLGEEVNIRYAALSKRDPGYSLYEGHFASDAATNSPRVRNFQGAIFVVEKFAADTGINSPGGGILPIVTQYKYAGAKLNAHGRGFLGFRRVKAQNLNTGIETVNIHFQEFPYTGMLEEAIQKVPDVTTVEYPEPVICPPGQPECPIAPPFETTTVGPEISKSTNSVAQFVLGSSATARVRFPYLQSSIETQRKFSPNTIFRQTTTTYTYDQNGNPTLILATVTDGSGGDSHSTWTYSQFNHTEQCPSRLTQSTVIQTAPATGTHGSGGIQRTATFQYHPTHCQLTQEVSNSGTAAALTRVFGYDAFGNRQSETVTGAGISPARTTTWNYDAKGRYLSTVINALGHVESYTWDQGLGVRLAATDANGLVRSWQHDAFGRETKAAGPRSTQFVDTVRSLCGSSCQHPQAVLRITRTSNGSSTEQATSVTELDRLGREVASGVRNVQGQMVYTLTYFDSAGRPYAGSGPYRPGLDAGACWTRLQFDMLGRVVHQHAAADHAHCGALAPPAPTGALPGWSHTQTVYDGLQTTVTDPEGRQRRTVVNVMDRLRFVQEHDGQAWQQTEYRYNNHGDTTWVQAPGGVLTTSVYDGAGRKTSMSDPSMGSWSYAYNAAGELTSQTDANGTTVTMTYDALGRLLTRTEPEGTTTFTYDQVAQGAARGNVTNISGPHGYLERFWYHGDGGEMSASARYLGDTWFWMHYDYNTLGQVERIRYPSVDCAAPCSSAPPDAGRLRVNQHYRYGHLYQVRELQPNGVEGTVYWEALEVDALGEVTRQKLGNNLETLRYVNPATGLVESILTGPGSNIQNLETEWDRVGNLTRRIDHKVDRREDLRYDRLGRLKGVTLMTAAGNTLGAETVQYGPSGNILNKGNFSNYQYNHTNRPHQVSAVTTPSGVRGYQYDANGNLTQVTGPGARTVTWWSFNKPRRLEKDGNNHSEYWYGPGGDRALFRQSARINGQLELIWYGSALYERRHVDATVEHTHYVQANGGTVAVVKRSGTNVTNTPRYLHKDHLGSVVAITNESGTIVESLAYDAWGKRRPATTWQTPSPGVFMAVVELRRGFTLHEHIDHVGLVHMGGRVYDPEIGRFLSPDPFVQFPASTQGFNRYAYVSNNPLSYTDPSGYFLKKLGRYLALPAAVFIPNPIVAGAVAGYLGSGGDLKAAALGAVGGAIFHSIGNQFGEVGFGSAAHFQKTLAHGLAGGLLSQAGGGRFGDGFLGAAAGQLAAPAIDGIGRGANGQIATDPASRLARVVSAAAVGGTASTIGGGKFANGAISAGFARAMNDERHLREERSVAMRLPTLPQWSVDLAVGAGDGIWNAITYPARLLVDEPATLGDVRALLGIDGGVEVESSAYRVGHFSGNVIGGTALYGGVSLSYVPALGPSSSAIGHPMYGGSTLPALRSGLRFGWNRHNGPVLRAAYRDRWKADIHRGKR